MSPDDIEAVPLARAVLAGIPPYRAGKPAIDDAHKLSSNENPYPPLPSVVEALQGELGRFNRYPDAGNTALVEALAETLGVEPAQVAAGTGSVAVLFTLLATFCDVGDEVVHAWRSFEAYPIAVELSGARSVRVPVTASGEHDLDAMLAAIGPRTKAVLVCTPNNPTGPIVRHDALLRFVDQVPRDVLVVVDEAYVEFVRDDAAARGLEVLRERSNVVVLRTFSKAYGLAGLRVGYAVSTPSIAGEVRKATPPFSVSGPAQAAAVASLGLAGELMQRVDAVVAERTRVVLALRAQGWDVPDTEANFVWLPLGEDSMAFAEHAAPVAVRAFAGTREQGGGVRVTIGDPAVNDLFLAQAAAWLAR